MQAKEEIIPYEFLFSEGIHHVYGFETDNAIVYQIKFKNTSYIFEQHLDFPIVAFEFVISVALNPTDKSPSLDNRVSHTVALIFKDFFKKTPEQVIIYICDSSDRRGAVRKRKFDQWVDYFKENEFVKVNATIIDLVGITYYNALIIRKDNPNRLAITEAFINLAEEQDK